MRELEKGDKNSKSLLANVLDLEVNLGVDRDGCSDHNFRRIFRKIRIVFLYKGFYSVSR
jgi:hypothetical protein